MGYRKISSSQVFNGYKILNNYTIVLNDKGLILDLLPMDNSPADCEHLEGLLAPGLVNAHCHLELSHMKGLIPEGTGLVDFVYKVVTERHFSEAEILASISDAEQEMIRNGIVATGDICNNILTLPQKQKQNISYYNFIESSGWSPAVANERFDRAKNIYEKFRSSLVNKYNPHQPQTSIVPHAPYSVAENLWQNIIPYFRSKAVTIHNQETIFEDEFFISGTGDFQRMYQLMNIDNTHHKPTSKSSLQSIYHHLSGASSVILVHNTFIKQDDLDFIDKKNKAEEPKTLNTKHKIFFCLCPNANLYIEKTLPPVELLRKNNCKIVLGTDSLASNHSLNIMDEIKTLMVHFPDLTIEEALQWATINGARALNMDNDIGSIEKGKMPGLVEINLNNYQIRKVI